MRGFYTNPSRADDCFVPFSSGAAPFLTYRPERNVDGKWINQLVLFDCVNADIYLNQNNWSMTIKNSYFEIFLKNHTIGTIKFIKAGKYYFNSQGTTTDLTSSNDKKEVAVSKDTVINWSVISSNGYLVVVKVG